MPVNSSHQPISIPSVDLWSLLFERSDREYPDNQVLFSDIQSSTHYTFSNVRKASQDFGSGLQFHFKWHKGDILALFTPNNADIALVSFGTLWAGGVVCPFNNLYTVGELVSQLRSSGAKLLVTHLSCLDVAREAALLAGLPLNRLILVGEEDPKGQITHFSRIQSKEHPLTRPVIYPDQDLAFLVYSSGTTGLPKGVMLSHRNIVANILQSHTIEKDLTDWRRDRLIGFLPMFHIYGIAIMLLLPLYKGLTVFIMQRFELDKFCLTIQRNKITSAYVVPPVVLLLAKHPSIANYDLSSLRIMHSSAAPLTRDLVELVYARLRVPIKQGYGLSEASPGVATQAWDKWNQPIGSVGNILPSMSLKIVLDNTEVPEGQEGEIWVKGPNVFHGYYHNPKATADSITKDGWYKTGDVGFVDKEKNLYITDRVKELIKYNGFQVAPAQLEGLLLAHPAVNDVAVIGIYSEEKATELPRAYIVLAAGYPETETLKVELTTWLAQRVAPYKRLRGGIRFIKEIPKSTAGKVLRRVLSEQAKKEGLHNRVRALL